MKKGDAIVLVLAAIFVASLYAGFWGHVADAQVVRIDAGGTHFADIPLAADQTVRVPGPLGVSVIRIEHGRARFVSSPCPGKLCVLTGWISHSGEAAICLPNRISIEITGGKLAYDSINF